MMKAKINAFQGQIELYCIKMNTKHIRYLVDYASHENINISTTTTIEEEISLENTYLVGTAPDDVKAHLSRVCCLQFNLDAVQLPLEPILRAGIKHLASHSRGIRGPSKTNIAVLIYNRIIKATNAHTKYNIKKGYHAMKKILLFWQFSSVTKSKS